MNTIGHIQNLTKCDIVVESIKNGIIRGDYKQGDRLPPEQALCDQYGVSRITIRESLKKLNMMGIVTIQQGKGTFVETIDLGFFMRPMYQLINFEEVDIDAIYDARLYVENCSAKLAAKNRTEEHLERMKSILAHNKKLMESGDLLHGIQFDTEFHVTIAQASANELIKAMVITLEDITQACVRRKGGMHNFMDVSYEQHLSIFNSIKDRDEKNAEKRMTIHTLKSRDFLNSL